MRIPHLNRFIFLYHSVILRLSIILILIKQVFFSFYCFLFKLSSSHDFSRDPSFSNYEIEYLNQLFFRKKLKANIEVSDQELVKLQVLGFEVSSPSKNKGAGLSQLAKQFQDKGNYFISRKVYATAQILENEELDLIDNIYFSGHPSQSLYDVKLDFLFVPTIRSGSSAIANFLNLHPEIYIPPKSMVDKAISNNNISALNNIATQSRRSKFKSALVLHNFIPGNSFLLEPKLWLPKRNLIAESIKNEKFFQIVRDPIDTAFSHIVHEELIPYLIPWGSFGNPENRTNLMCKKNFDICNPKPINLNFKVDSYPSERLTEIALTRAKLAATDFAFHFDNVEKEFLKSFSKSHILDLTDLSNPKASEALRCIFYEMKVDQSFSHEIIGTSQNSLANRFLYHYSVGSFVEKYQLPLGLYFANEGILSNDLNLIELTQFNCSTDWKAAGLPRKRLALTCHLEAWLAIPLLKRTEIIKSIDFDFIAREFIEPTIISAWQNFWAITQPISHGLRPEFEKWFVAAELPKQRERIANFVKKHPELEKKWKTAKHL